MKSTTCRQSKFCRPPGPLRNIFSAKRVRVGLAAALCLVVFAVEWRIWRPPVSPVSKADAVVALAYRHDRVELAEQLVADAVAPNLVISVSAEMRAAGKVPDCDADTFCIFPAPNNTYGEAIAYRKLAEEQGWSSVVVVTEVSHLRRALTIFEACVPGEIQGAASYPGGPMRNLWRAGYEFLAQIKLWVDGPGC